MPLIDGGALWSSSGGGSAVVLTVVVDSVVSGAAVVSELASSPSDEHDTAIRSEQTQTTATRFMETLPVACPKH